MILNKKVWAGAVIAAVFLTGGIAAVVGAPHNSANAQVSSAQSMPTWCASQSKALILGDSTTTGYGTTGYPANGAGYVATANSWVATLDIQMAETQFINLARNGALTSDFLPNGVGVEGRPAGPLVPEALTRIQTEQPSLVIITLGANEYGTDRRPEQVYRANLQRLTNDIRTAAPQTSILYVHTWGFDFRWATGAALPIEYTWANYEQVIRSIAESTTNADYLDLTQYMPWADTDTAGLFIANEYGAGNPVHTTNAGNWPVRAAVQGALECN